MTFSLVVVILKQFFTQELEDFIFHLTNSCHRNLRILDIGFVEPNIYSLDQADTKGRPQDNPTFSTELEQTSGIY